MCFWWFGYNLTVVSPLLILIVHFEESYMKDLTEYLFNVLEFRIRIYHYFNSVYICSTDGRYVRREDMAGISTVPLSRVEYRAQQR